MKKLAIMTLTTALLVTLFAGCTHEPLTPSSLAGTAWETSDETGLVRLTFKDDTYTEHIEIFKLWGEDVHQTKDLTGTYDYGTPSVTLYQDSKSGSARSTYCTGTVNGETLRITVRNNTHLYHRLY